MKPVHLLRLQIRFIGATSGISLTFHRVIQLASGQSFFFGNGALCCYSQQNIYSKGEPLFGIRSSYMTYNYYQAFTILFPLPFSHSSLPLPYTSLATAYHSSANKKRAMGY